MGYFIKNTDNGAFLVDTGDIIGNVIMSTGKWERNIEAVYKSLIKPEYLSINIGANLGYHTIKLATISNKVIAFEPQRKIYNQLCSNIYLNEMDTKIEAYQLALGDVNESANLASTQDNPNAVCGELTNYGGISLIGDHIGESVEVHTLDSFNFNPDFILMDAERFEGKILKGGEETISKNKPTLLLEIWKADTDERFYQLKYLGYEIYWRGDFIDNYIALHPEFKDYEEQKEILKSLEFFELSFSYDKCNI
jgi:FkbM family methyltransferase